MPLVRSCDSCTGLQHYGLQKIAKAHVTEFVSSLRKHYNEHPRIKLFADLCGAKEQPLEQHYVDFYIDTLGHVFSRAGVKSLPIDRSTSDVILPLDACLDVIETCFPTLNPSEHERFADMVISKAIIRRGEAPSYINMDTFMGTIMHSYMAIMKDRADRLETIFTQGDFNGGANSCPHACHLECHAEPRPWADGVLSLEEFVAIVKVADLAQTERQVMDMFKVRRRAAVTAVGGVGMLLWLLWAVWA